MGHWKFERVIRGAMVSIVVALAIVWGCCFVLDRRMSEAVVVGGIAPGFAAWSESTFKAAFTGAPAIAPLESMGKTLVVAKGTRCRVVTEDHLVHCDGDYYATQVQFLDGSYRSRVAWMCSDCVRMLHPWP